MEWARIYFGQRLQYLANFLGKAAVSGLVIATVIGAMPRSFCAWILSDWPSAVLNFIRYGQSVPSWPVGLAFIALVLVAWTIGELGELIIPESYRRIANRMKF